MPAHRLGIATLAVIVVAVVAFGGWYYLIRDDAPPPVNLDAAVSSVRTATPATTQTPGATATATEDAVTTETATPAATAPPVAGPVGTWLVSSAGEIFAGYRIGEELASIGTNTAVGRTSNVTGALEFDGAAITAVTIEVDMTTLRSDDSRRDNQLRRRGLQTSAFPTATFSLTSPVPIERIPDEGVSISAVATGELTLHGVTQPVSIALEGQLVDDLVVVVGSTEIALADYGIEPPTGFSVLSVDDVGTMEFQLVFERQT